MAIERFTVFGQRCSGTNALIKLLETNLPTLPFCEKAGFKHWLVPDTRELPHDLLVIVIAREVGSWLRSLHRNPWHVVPEMRELEFSQFIRAEWRTVWDEDFWGIDRIHPLFGKQIAEETCLRTGKPFENAIAMRTAKLTNWLNLAERSAAFFSLSHQQLIGDPEDIVNRVGAICGHEPIKPFRAISTYKGAGSKPFTPKPSQPLSQGDRLHVERFWDRTIENEFAFAE